MPDLTFTATSNIDGSLRRWDLSGPAGVVRFEITDAAGFQASSIYLHNRRPGAGSDLEDCEVCGRGWHDAAGGDHARDLRRRWESGGGSETAIRTELERWYRAELGAER